MSHLKIIAYDMPATQLGEIHGKFVQLFIAGVEHLVFMPKTTQPYHNLILGQFCAEQRIACRWEDGTLIIDQPDIEVRGDGKFILDHGARRLTLHDNSQVYGRFDETGLVERIKDSAHPWRGYHIVITD
ncbi:MAG: hypothetical protein AB1810_13025 [Pseudomonadota bacterium]